MKPVDNSGDEAYPSLECCEREEGSSSAIGFCVERPLDKVVSRK